MFKKRDKSKIVSAVGIASSSHLGGRVLAQRIEKAMADAVLECNAEGISTEEKNSAIIRDRMQKARRRVIDEFAVAQAPKESNE